LPGVFNPSPESPNGAEASTASSSWNALWAHNDSTAAVPAGVIGGHGIFTTTSTPTGSGVFGTNSSTGVGVSGFSAQGDGTRGDTQASGKNGLVGANASTDAVPAGQPGGNGVYGYSTNPAASGVLGINSSTGVGVSGFSAQGDGTRGDTQASGKNGLVGTNASTTAVPAGQPGGNGVYGYSTNPNASGVLGIAQGGGTGIAGYSADGVGVRGGGKTAGHFDGNVEVTGDISLLGADCAEDFDIIAAEDVEAGSVMIIDQSGALRTSEGAYDKRVAGVVSGAGDYKPGIVLDRGGPRAGRKAIALVGKVFCKVDASRHPVQVGDLLTTAPLPGHAMKADDPGRAFGAVLGKALRPLERGQGLIPILVALQ
jgi:hypothetical protein